MMMHRLMRPTFPAFLMAMVTAVALALPLATAQAQDGAQRLEWKFNAGDVMRYRISASANVQSQMGGGAQNSQVTVLKFEVKSLRDGKATIAVTHESIRAQAVQPFGEMTWDSKEDPQARNAQDPTFRAMAKVIGKTFTIVVDATGTVHEIQGMQEIFAEMAREVAGGGPMGQMAAQQLESQFGSTAMKHMMESIFGVVPKEPVTVGSSWSMGMQNALMFGMLTHTMRLNYAENLRTPHGMAAKFTIAGETTLDRSNAQGPMARLEISLKSATHSGEGLFGISNGRLLKSTANMRMVLVLAAGRGMEMEQSIDQTRVVELLTGEADEPQRPHTPERPGTDDDEF